MLQVLSKSKSRDSLYCLIALFIYFILHIILLLRHEPWRDEAQAWLLARDVRDFTTLFRMMGYEGHPFLWHLLLWFPSRLGLPFFTIKIINLTAITGAVAVFMHYAPFKTVYKIPIVFGYFFFYEYGIISRCYSVAVLLLFVVAALYPSRFKNKLLFASAIVLLANTCVYFFFISILLFGIYVYELKREKLFSNKGSLLAMGIIAAGLVFVGLQLQPPADLSPLLKEWHISTNFKKYLNGIYFLAIATFFQVPVLKMQFWNTEILYNETFKFAGFFIFIFIFILIPRRLPLVLYSLSVIILYMIHIFKYTLSVYHFGQLYFMFLFCLWISRYYQKEVRWRAAAYHRLRYVFPRGQIVGLRIRPLLGGVVLGLHIFASAVACYFDYNYDFSPGPGIARYLEMKGYLKDDVLIAFQPSSVAASILPYLDKKQKFYFLEYQDFGSYMIWNETYERARYLDVHNLLLRIYHGLARKQYHKLLLVLDRDIDPFIKVEKRIFFLKVIAGSESLRLYDINLVDGWPVW